MSKTLSVILTIFKVARIVAKVVFILCIVGGVGCLASLVLLPIVQMLPSDILPSDVALQIPSALIACAIGVVSCVAAAVTAYFAEKYFTNVEKAGTPFTLDGSKECFRLGIVSLIASAGSVLISEILLMILQLAFKTSVSNVEGDLDITAGLLLLFLSLVFKYGAELVSEKNAKIGEDGACNDETAQSENTPTETNTPDGEQ